MDVAVRFADRQKTTSVSMADVVFLYKGLTGILPQTILATEEHLRAEAMLKTTEESARAFLATRKTLVMATTGEDGAPTASYAPFVKWGDDFYVYTSALSRHTKDLLRSPNVSILFIEDGASAKNLFALERLTFPCRTTTVSQNGNEWKVVMTLFRKKFGKIFGLIRPLGDFFLFRMEPEDTVYVQAFGRAYHLTKDLQDPQHITGVGHKGAEIDTAKGVRGSRASGKKR